MVETSQEGWTRRDWAMSVSNGTMQRRRTPYHFLDFLAWVFRLRFFYCGCFFLFVFSLAT